ncbi:AtpZ/AtpI family protein [Pacificispira sp.]|uniref:AtpZ/AtpI family protein n=1 Tax=Pacificispira sp. TaxID=2888761 RepID=UPI003B52BFE7
MRPVPDGQAAPETARSRNPGCKGSASPALRVGTELVAATGIGVAIGYGLDRWLGTGPWLLIFFLFLGGAAGVTNVYRLASGMDQGVGWRRPGDNTPDKDDGRGES